MNALTRVVAAWLRWREDRRNRVARPGHDDQFAEWLPNHALLRHAARWRAEVDDLDARRARWALEHQKRTEELDQARELLGVIWLYVDWRYVTKQLTTEQKNLWADAVDSTSDGPVAERWWTA